MSFMTSLTTMCGYVYIMTAVFIDPDTGCKAEYEILQFLLAERMLLTLHNAVLLRTCFLVARVIKEAVSWL